MEIERKWLLNGFPASIYKTEGEFHICQSYLSTIEEVRIRSMQDLHDKESTVDYFLSFKTSGDLTREEVEIKIDENTYERIYAMINYPPIQKDYRRYEFAGFIIEISKVDDSWYYGEVEFENEEVANEFKFPFTDLIIKEVTDDPDYKMRNYWNRTHDIKLMPNIAEC